MPFSPLSPARSPLRALLLAVSVAPSLAACSRGDDGSVTTAHARGESVRSANGPEGGVPLPGIVPASAAYVVEAVTNGGVVAGTVQLDGPAPVDSSIVPPEAIQRQCGARFTDATVQARDGRLAGAVVWLEGVGRGKAPPMRRRHEVSIVKCRLTPRVQAVMAGGTLHVHSEDRLKSLVRVLRWPGGDVAATIAMNDDGQVVPDDRVLARPAALELKGAQPAWLRAWVLAFDHPYATTSADGGTFSLDSVPAGQYTLVAWHERLGRVSQPVAVTPGQTTTVVLRLGAPNGQVTAADTAPRTP